MTFPVGSESLLEDVLFDIVASCLWFVRNLDGIELFGQVCCCCCFSSLGRTSDVLALRRADVGWWFVLVIGIGFVFIEIGDLALDSAWIGGVGVAVSGIGVIMLQGRVLEFAILSANPVLMAKRLDLGRMSNGE